MTNSERENLESLLTALRAHGVRKFRSGDLFLELGPLESEAAPADVPLDPSKCLVCQKNEPGRMVKGLCRTCGLAEAGVT